MTKPEQLDAEIATTESGSVILQIDNWEYEFTDPEKALDVSRTLASHAVLAEAKQEHPQ